MKNKVFTITNEKFKVAPSTDPSIVQVNYSYVYREEEIIRFYTYKKIGKKNNFYYVAKARGQVAREKANGKLENYTKNYFSDVKTSTAKKVILYAGCPLLITGLIVGSVFLAHHYLAPKWTKISDDEAAKIASKIVEGQKFSIEDGEYDEEDYRFFSTISEHGDEVKYHHQVVGNFPGWYQNGGADDQTWSDQTVDFSIKNYQIYYRSAVNYSNYYKNNSNAHYIDVRYQIYREIDDATSGIYTFDQEKEREEAGEVPVRPGHEYILGDYDVCLARFENDLYGREVWLPDPVLTPDIYFGHTIPLTNSDMPMSNKTVASIAMYSPIVVLYGLSTDKDTYFESLSSFDPTALIEDYGFYVNDDNTIKINAKISTMLSPLAPINGEARSLSYIYVDAEFKDSVCVKNNLRMEFKDKNNLSYYVEYRNTISHEAVNKTPGWDTWEIEHK